MAKAKKAPGKKGPGKKIATTKIAAKKQGSDGDLIVPKDATSVSFVQGLLARGQAARANKDGSLPPGATHEIVGETPTGLPILRRRRFA